MGLERGTVNPAFWKNKKVFLTGHTGFKGSWMSLWLQEMGALVHGYSLEPDSGPALFTEASVKKNMESTIGDIRDLSKITECMTSFDPDILIHMAAQPLVRKSYADPVETYAQTSVTKTRNGNGVIERTRLWVVMTRTAAVKVVQSWSLPHIEGHFLTRQTLRLWLLPGQEMSSVVAIGLQIDSYLIYCPLSRKRNPLS
jgi:nucleoside-diphosphate-sugar epimerase